MAKKNVFHGLKTVSMINFIFWRIIMSSDWMPANRQDQWNMANNFSGYTALSVLELFGGAA
jgi:hypothetical protein